MAVYNAFATTRQGYRPDLPTFSPLITSGGVIVKGTAVILAWASAFEKERKAKLAPSVVKKAAPHPRATGRTSRPSGSPMLS